MPSHFEIPQAAGGGGGAPAAHASTHEADGSDEIHTLDEPFVVQDAGNSDRFVVEDDGSDGVRVKLYDSAGIVRVWLWVQPDGEPVIEMFEDDGTKRILIDIEGNPGLNILDAAGTNVVAQVVQSFVGVTSPDQSAYLAIDFTSAGNGTLNINDKISMTETGTFQHIAGTIGFNGATPQAQGGAIADSDLTNVHTKLNTLLAYLRARGDIAT